MVGKKVNSSGDGFVWSHFSGARAGASLRSQLLEPAPLISGFLDLFGTLLQAKMYFQKCIQIEEKLVKHTVHRLKGGLFIGIFCISILHFNLQYVQSFVRDWLSILCQARQFESFEEFLL